MKSTSNDDTCVCSSNSYDVLTYNVGETAATQADDCKAPESTIWMHLEYYHMYLFIHLVMNVLVLVLSPDTSSFQVNTLVWTF